MKIQITHAIVSLVALTLLAIPAANVAQAAPGSQRTVEEFAIQQDAGTALAQSWQPAVIKTIFERSKLTAADGESSDFFGDSVCISGNLALIGAPYDDDNGLDSGSAYIYAFDGAGWVQQAKLISSDGVDFDSFGNAVASSGNIALVAAIGNNRASGAVYFFAFDGTTWSQQAKITAADSEGGDEFGQSISLSGNRALVGARDKDAAYVFAFDGTTWNQQAKLTALDAAMNDFFGSSVSLLGERALVGAIGKDDNTGAAYVFAFDGATWNQQAKLTAPNARRGDSFGTAVALSPTRAFIGDPQVHLNPGVVYVFSSSGDQWKREARLAASDGGVSDEFGISLSVSGRNVLIGAVGADSDNGINTGAGYFFSLPRLP